jgi:hypothetical protein
VQYFDVEYTDTQATLFRDDSAQELIIAFRGTSSPADLDTDFLFGLVPLTAAGTSCPTCKVRHLLHKDSHVSVPNNCNVVVKPKQRLNFYVGSSRLSERI